MLHYAGIKLILENAIVSSGIIEISLTFYGCAHANVMVRLKILWQNICLYTFPIKDVREVVKA